MAYHTFTNGEVLTDTLINTYLMKQAVIVCTSGTRPSSPPTGMTIYETDTGQVKFYDGTAWRRSGAFDHETYGSKFSSDSTTLSGIVSTTFAAGSPVVGVAFKAPPSGTVFITTAGTVRQSSNGNETRLSYSIRAGAVIGSGAVQVASSSLRGVVCGLAVVTSGPSMNGSSFRHPHSGLTPGGDYNVCTEHCVSGGTGSISYRMVSVEPML